MRRNLWLSLAVAALVFAGLGVLFLAGGVALAGWPGAAPGPALASLPPGTNSIAGASTTPTICPAANYSIAQSTGASIVPGTTDIGNNCDDCVTNVALPF